MLLLSFQIFSNTSNEVAAAYITGVIGVIFGIFQYVSKERDRKKNQVNAIELEKFKQRSELFMNLKKNQIGYNDELLNEVYRVRIILDKTLQTPGMKEYELLDANLNVFEKYYRANASKINYLDESARSHAHDILLHSNKLSNILHLSRSRNLTQEQEERIQFTCNKLHSIFTEYEQFLRNTAVNEFTNLSTD